MSDTAENGRQPERADWRRVGAWGALVLAVVAGLSGGGYWLFQERDPGAGIEVVVPTPAPVVVQVSGAVANPGVYELANGARVQDLIDTAGGAYSDADLESMNLARELRDGERLNVPRSNGAVASGSTGGDAPGSTGGSDNGLVDLNTASRSELESLPNIGEARAELVIAFRNQSGPIQSVDELLEISGIGPVTVDSIRDLVVQP